MRRLLPAVILVLVVAACGGDDPSTTAPSAGTTVPTVTIAPSPTEPATTEPGTTVPSTTVPSTTEPSTTVPSTTVPSTTVPSTAVPGVLGEALVGRWAHYDVVAYEDGTLKTLIVSYGFNDFTEVDGRIVDSARFCFSEQRTDQPIETSLSDAATQAIKPPSTPIEVDEVDGTLRVRRAATPTPVGIRLDDPATESLPTDPNDPRIVDDDRDGNPGITVSIRVSNELTGELYIARREIFAYEAFLTDPDTLTGTVTDDSEQLIIGASDPIFAIESDWVQHPDPSKSPIILKRVDDGWDCERLAAERDDLFPPTPDVDW